MASGESQQHVDAQQQADPEGSAVKKIRSPKLDDHGVMSLDDLERDGIEVEVAPETQRTGWKINTAPSSIDETPILKLALTNPPVKMMSLHFTTGVTIVARNRDGITIKDALDAIYKHYKKKPDDELELAYLAGFEWSTSSWKQLVVHLKRDAGTHMSKKRK